jgi:NitT/TauT family transport system permease protein
MSSDPATAVSRRWQPVVDALVGSVRVYGPPLLVFFVVLAIWEIATSGEGRRTIPPPSRLLESVAEEQDLILNAAIATFSEAIGGLAIGSILGVTVAFAISRWVVLRDVLLPVAIGASAIPLVAAAPIITNWFGSTSQLSMMVMASLLVFFPVMVNTTRGLVEVEPASLELMRSYAASENDIVRRVRVPHMLPFLFTALKVASTLAFIGAIVAEYFGGSRGVLGKVVLEMVNAGRNGLAWGAIIVAASGAITAYLIVSIVERLVIPWHRTLHDDQD